MRSPLASAPLICSTTLRTASSTSAKARWVWRNASVSISSDLVMGGRGFDVADATFRLLLACGASRPARAGRRSLRLVHLLFQECAEFRGRAAGVLVIRQRFGQLVFILGTHGQLQHAALAIHADELGFDRV